MPTVQISEFEDSFVIHFGGEFSRINVYTLASTLINIADAAKAANATINPGYEIEIVVEALGAGSFKARIKSFYRGASNLFTGENLKAIVLGVIASFIYQHTLAPNTDVTVNLSAAEVVIVQGDKRIIVPRVIHDSMQQVEKSPNFRRGIGQAIRSIEEDPTITSIGFSRNIEDSHPPLKIHRDQFSQMPAYLGGPEGDSRELIELTDIEILRAILERSRRRWEFVWNGMKISAPVTDDHFYNEFFAHRIKIAPGDVLRVRLKICQRRSPDIGIFVNESYEVVEVIRHISRPGQMGLGLETRGE